MGVFPKIWEYPQIIHFNRVWNHYKPSNFGYPYFWKHSPIFSSHSYSTYLCVWKYARLTKTVHYSLIYICAYPRIDWYALWYGTFFSCFQLVNGYVRGDVRLSYICMHILPNVNTMRLELFGFWVRIFWNNDISIDYRVPTTDCPNQNQSPSSKRHTVSIYPPDPSGKLIWQWTIPSLNSESMYNYSDDILVCRSVYHQKFGLYCHEWKHFSCRQRFGKLAPV